MEGTGTSERPISPRKQTQQVTLQAVTKALSRGQSQGQGGGRQRWLSPELPGAPANSAQDPPRLPASLPSVPHPRAGWGVQTPPTRAAGVWTSFH